MEEFSADLSVALEEANQQDSDSCTEQVMQKPRRPRRRRPRAKDGNKSIISPVSHSEGVSPERPRRAKRPPRMQVEMSGGLGDGVDCAMLSAGSGSDGSMSDRSDIGVSDCEHCQHNKCGHSSEADDEQTDFPLNEPPPPKIQAIRTDEGDWAAPNSIPASNVSSGTEFRRRVHSAGNRNQNTDQSRKRRRRCCPLGAMNPSTHMGSPSVSDSSQGGHKLLKGVTGYCHPPI